MNEIKKIVIFVSGSGTHLQNFINHQANLKGAQSYLIEAVICNNPNAGAIERAEKAKIPVILVNHHNYDSREDFEKKIVFELSQFNFDLILLAGFMRLLSPYFFSVIHQPIINIHPSLLPKYKGVNIYKKVLSSQDRYHGASVHLVIAELDSGDVIKQVKIPISPNDDVNSLQKKLLPVEHQLFLEVVYWFCSNRLKIKNNKAYLAEKLIKYPIIETCD